MKCSWWVVLNWNVSVASSFGVRIWHWLHWTCSHWRCWRQKQPRAAAFQNLPNFGLAHGLCCALECHIQISELVDNPALELKSGRAELWLSCWILQGGGIITLSAIVRKSSYSSRSWTENSTVLHWAAWWNCHKSELLLCLGLLYLLNSPFIIFCLKMTWGFSTLSSNAWGICLPKGKAALK